MPRRPNHRWCHAGTSTERGYGAEWRKLRAAALARDNHLCQACLAADKLTPATDVDHVTPKSKGGADDLSNLQSLCRRHHDEKTAREAAEAQGRRVKKRICFDADGRPVW
ncbi:HNH endonuclease [Pseudochelatococcus sp. B33]